MRKKSLLVLIVFVVAVLSFSLGAFAADPIKIIVNGKQLQPDVAPQIINGRTMVPIRFVADALGAEVGWDAANNSVIITTATQATSNPIPQGNVGTSRSNPLPAGQKILTPDGYEISLVKMVHGNSAWQIAKEANMFNEEPEPGHKYVMISVKVKNVSSDKEPSFISGSSFRLVGSSNKIFNTYDRSLVLPDNGEFKSLNAQLYHGGEVVGGMSFYVPENESNLVLIWDNSWDDSKKRYLRVE